MHRYTYLALILAGGLVTTGTRALAQTPEAAGPAAAADSGRRAMGPIGRLLAQRERLKLTDDQVRRLEEIRTKYQEKHQGHMEQMRRDREARSAFRASMDSARAEIAAVLTPEQEKQVEAMRKEWRREWRDHHRGRHHHRDHDDHSRDS